MPNLTTELEPGAVILIPAGSSASIEFVEKSGRRSRVRIMCDAPVTITKSRPQDAAPRPAGDAPAAAPKIARRPVQRTG